MACSVRADRYHGFANDFIGLVLDRAISIYTNEFIFCVQCRRSRSATKFDTKINLPVLSRFANVPKKEETSTRLTNAVLYSRPDGRISRQGVADRDRNDPSSGLTSLNHGANLSGPVLGRIDASDRESRLIFSISLDLQ